MNIYLTVKNKIGLFHKPKMSLQGEAPSGILTLRMIMSGKDVGHLIGIGGDTIKTLRKESGAKIFVNDGSSLEKKFVSKESCPERMVTVVGTIDSIFRAYSLICKKMEEREDSRKLEKGLTEKKEDLSLRLVLPSFQCGSLIGKGGKKIKEIREVTSATVNVESEPLPGSTERSVTVGGSYDAVTQCIYHICCVMLQNPVQGTTVDYIPRRGGGTKKRLGEEQGQCNSLGRHNLQESVLTVLCNPQVMNAVKLIGQIGNIGARKKIKQVRIVKKLCL